MLDVAIILTRQVFDCVQYGLPLLGRQLVDDRLDPLDRALGAVSFTSLPFGNLARQLFIGAPLSITPA